MDEKTWDASTRGGNDLLRSESVKVTTVESKESKKEEMEQLHSPRKLNAHAIIENIKNY